MVKLNIAGAVLAAAGKTSPPHFFCPCTRPAVVAPSTIPQPCSLHSQHHNAALEHPYRHDNLFNSSLEDIVC